MRRQAAPIPPGRAGRPRFALLIGIDGYPGEGVGGLPPDPQLRGAVGDALRMERYLRQHLGVPAAGIRKLLAPAEMPGDPYAGSLPSYQAIVAGLRWLAEVVEPGDPVLVHYSGHGGRALTVVPELRGAQELDEVLVPWSPPGEAPRLLHDVELACLVEGIIASGAFLTLVLDSCHSGGALRGGLPGQLVPRSVGDLEEASRSPRTLVADPRELAAAWRRLSPRTVTADAGWLPTSKAYVLAAACKAQEQAYECTLDGSTYQGLFTHWLLKSLEDPRTAWTYEEVRDVVTGRVRTASRDQNPTFEGALDRLLFGEVPDRPRTVGSPVLRVEEGGRRALIQVGEPQMARPDDSYRIYPLGHGGSTGDEDCVEARLVQVGATESWAAVQGALTSRVEVGCRAVLSRRGSESLRRKVELAGTSPWRRRLERQIQEEERGLLALRRPAEPPDFIVRLLPEGRVELCGQDRTRLLGVPGSLPLQDPRDAGDLVALLGHLALFCDLVELTNPDPESILAGALEVELCRPASEPSTPGGPESLEPLPVATPGGVPTLRSGERFRLRIRNRARQTLNVTALDLSSTWGVCQIEPTNGTNRTLEPGAQHVLDLEASLPPGLAGGREILKVFATVEDSNFLSLQLPELEPDASVLPASARSRSDSLTVLRSLASRTRAGLEPSETPSWEWTSTQVELAIVAASEDES